MELEFSGKVALVTGAAVGIGRATAHLLAERGARLALLDLDAAGLARVRDELAKTCTDVRLYSCDVSDAAAVDAAVADVLEHFGKVDILVNNAALWKCHSSFVDTSLEEWRRYLDVNVMGVVHVTRAVLPSMLSHGYGRVVNVASVAGIYGNAKMVHYSATKGALISMTRALAKEVGSKGVLVNAVSPGSVSPSDIPDPNHVQPSQLSFAGRTGSNMENAELICFLASEGAGYICGQNIQIDGCRKKQ
jgi:NAD(P)-dependent dehydrogenase (short-subunit alcohol dehydrogenase family)